MLKSATSPLGTIDMEETDLGILEVEPAAALATAAAPAAAELLPAAVVVDKLVVGGGGCADRTWSPPPLPAVMVGEPIEKLANELASDSQRELRLVTML